MVTKFRKTLDEMYSERGELITEEEAWTIYCKIAKRYMPTHIGDFELMPPQSDERHNEMLDKLQPLIEQMGFDIEMDGFGAIQPYSESTPNSQNKHYDTMPMFDDPPF